MLKRTLFLLVFSVVTLALENPNVSLDDAKKYAITHNFDVIALRHAVEEARGRAGIARKGFFPKIGIAGGVDTDSSSKANESAVVGYGYIDYNIFNGFADSNQSQIAAGEAEKAEIKLQRAEFRVGLEVEQVFHLYLFKKGQLELKKEAFELNQTHKKMAQQKRAAGMVVESDIIEFDLRDSILKSDLVLIEQELEESRANLRKLLGEEIGGKIEPTGKLRHQHAKGSLMDYIKQIKEKSEAVVVAAKDLAIANSESRLWLSSLLPKFDVEIRAGYQPLLYRPADGGANLSAMALIKMDLFSGFETWNKRQEGQAKRLKAEAMLKDAILLSITKMEIAYRKLKAVQERVDLEEQNEERAVKYYKAVMSEYRRGVKNSGDVRVASDSLFDAHLRRESYKYEFLTNRIELEKALGAPVEVEMVEDIHPSHEGKKKKEH